MINFLSTDDLSKEQILDVFNLAKEIKRQQKDHIEHSYLQGKTLGMIFEKNSTRTRVSFEAGMYQLGGHAIHLTSLDSQLSRGESVKDTAQVLSRYVDALMIRTYSHQRVVDLAAYSTVPVINGLSDLLHPCQALTDIFTLMEKRNELVNVKIAYIGDGNNVAHSLLQLCVRLGADISIATPEGYACNEQIVQEAISHCNLSGSRVLITTNPEEAIVDSDAVYTDAWVSMGHESEKESRISIFSPYKVTQEMMQLARHDAVFMHCLPAYRGLEVDADVIDGPRSIVIDQAENRLHVQKALLTLLLGKSDMYFWDY